MHATCYQSSQIIGDENVPYHSRACTDKSDQCFVGIQNDTIIRGCLNEYAAAEQLEKASIAERFGIFFSTCENEALCNGDVFPIERCYESQTTDTIDQNIRPKLKKCKQNRDRFGCYHIEGSDDIILARGCVSDLDERQRHELQTNATEYVECSESGCNEKPNQQRCIEGTEDFSLPNRSQLGWKYCSEPYDKCFVHVSGNIIRRGCLNNAKLMYSDGSKIVSDCNVGDICETCSGTRDCNDKIIQTEFCIECNSEENALCANAPNLLMRKQCAMTVKPLGCYLNEQHGRGIERGCISNLRQQDRRICNDNENSNSCKTCFGDSCNVRQYFQECFHCNMTTDGDNCIDSPSLVELKRCTSYAGGGCYTMAKRGVFERGCVDTLSQSGKTLSRILKRTCEECHPRP